MHGKTCDNYFIVTQSPYFVMTTLSIGGSAKIRISSERGKRLIT